MNQVKGEALVLAAELLRPNDWNPNQMDRAMFESEVASIRAFGFVDPITCRQVATGPDGYFEIIDGEHRWRAGQALGMTHFPCWNLIDVDDDTARQLTIVLNETRGTSEQGKLSALVQDLLKRRDESSLRSVLPFSRERFNQLAARKSIDWEALEQKREAMQQESNDRWVERVFRMPAAAAEVLTEALAKARANESIDQDWAALELIAADYLGS